MEDEINWAIQEKKSSMKKSYLPDENWGIDYYIGLDIFCMHGSMCFVFNFLFWIDLDSQEGVKIGCSVSYTFLPASPSGDIVYN